MQLTRALLGMRYRKLRLTTKDVNKGFYKGTGSGAMGRHTKYGGYKIEWSRVRTYVCPSLEGFKLTPFVTNNMRPTYGVYNDANGPRNPANYLSRWKSENGLD
ncbi:mitochondrial ribosomal protein L27-domain-containing protein [Lasiosphaeria ovina]|uniref:Mitochondrial ribosomal protein L27-domain-containing protein n=1 Tax=Lasiosphaeria ovina TaxID=92902 RepID=A0AAE0NN28_9PEZI|nr:mitochondrial ribosomal protein L27-domain-containing protein [Lasiosphaeria ovina]